MLDENGNGFLFMIHPPRLDHYLKGGSYLLNKRLFGSLLVFAMVISSMAFVSGIAQTSKTPASKTSQVSNDLLATLPASDGVINVDVQRLLNEMLPRVLADNPAKLAEVNARIDQIKTRTAIDIRAFDRIAIGMRFVNAEKPDSLKVESVALARGNFSAPAMLAAGLLVSRDKYKYQQQKYGGKTIYIFRSEELFGKDQLPPVTVGEEAKKAGGKAAEMADDLLQKLMNLKGEIAIVAVDANTIAVGQLNSVRAAIDASAGRGRVSNALTALATRDPNGVVGCGLNVPAKASRFFGFENDQIAANIDAMRQVFGSVTSTTTGFEMQNIVRTATAPQAREVYDMFMGFKDLGGFFASNLTGDKGKLAQNALENLKITKEDNEVQIRLGLAQSDVAMLMRVFDKRN